MHSAVIDWIAAVYSMRPSLIRSTRGASLCCVRVFHSFHSFRSFRSFRSFQSFHFHMHSAQIAAAHVYETGWSRTGSLTPRPPSQIDAPAHPRNHLKRRRDRPSAARTVRRPFRSRPDQTRWSSRARSRSCVRPAPRPRPPASRRLPSRTWRSRRCW